MNEPRPSHWHHIPDDSFEIPTLTQLLGSTPLSRCGPEAALRRAVLISALEDIIAATVPAANPWIAARRAQYAADAMAWINGAAAHIEFESCAAAFGMGGRELRARIATWMVQPRQYRRGRHRLGRPAHAPAS